MSLYDYSQLCYIVVSLVFSVALSSIGNEKVRSTHWLKQAKRMLAVVFALVAVFTAVQYGFKLSSTHKTIDIALNITMLYLITFLLSKAFLPLASSSHLTPMRGLLTSVVFLICIALSWLSVFLNKLLSQIVLLASMAVYLTELVRITLVYVYNYRILNQQERAPGSDDEARFNCLHLVVRSIILLSVFAMIHLFLIMLADRPKAIYNFTILFVWTYVFAQFVNLIINYNPQAEKNINTANNQHITMVPHAELNQKVDKWIENMGYCQQGITMLQMAELFSTNRNYLSQYINTRFGCNFNTWLTKLRLDEAKRMLVSSPTLPIDSIAKATGFSTKSHFINTFKASEGMPPGQWRTKNSR